MLRLPRSLARRSAQASFRVMGSGTPYAMIASTAREGPSGTRGTPRRRCPPPQPASGPPPGSPKGAGALARPAHPKRPSRNLSSTKRFLPSCSGGPELDAELLLRCFRGILRAKSVRSRSHDEAVSDAIAARGRGCSRTRTCRGYALFALARAEPHPRSTGLSCAAARAPSTRPPRGRHRHPASRAPSTRARGWSLGDYGCCFCRHCHTSIATPLV